MSRLSAGMLEGDKEADEVGVSGISIVDILRAVGVVVVETFGVEIGEVVPPPLGGVDTVDAICGLEGRCN